MPDTVGPLAAFAAVGALLPDLDAAQSKICSFQIKGIRPFVPLSFLANRAFGHRGLLHSPAGWAGFGLLCLTLAFFLRGTGWDWEPPLGLFLGYGSHLVADACTRSGIPTTGLPRLIRHTRRLYLLPTRWRFVTGSLAEEALLPVLAGGAMLLLLPFLIP